MCANFLELNCDKLLSEVTTPNKCWYKITLRTNWLQLEYMKVVLACANSMRVHSEAALEPKFWTITKTITI